MRILASDRGRIRSLIRDLEPLAERLNLAESGMAAFGVRMTIADVQPVGSCSEADPMQTFASIIRLAVMLEVAIRNRANSLPDSEALAGLWRSKFCARNLRKLGVSLAYRRLLIHEPATESARLPHRTGRARIHNYSSRSRDHLPLPKPLLLGSGQNCLLQFGRGAF